jgi:PKD repeat protein
MWDFGDNAPVTGLTVNHVYTKAGTYMVTLTVTDDEGLTNTATAMVTVSRTTLDVEVDVGSIHFRGEIAEFYVLVSFMGEPVDATISAVLYYSNGTAHEELTGFVEHVATGLYRLPYTIPIDAPTGTYVMVANASLFTIKGSSLGSFLVSPTLTDAWLVDVGDDIATIRTDVTTIKVSLESINAKIEDIIEMLPFKKKVANIKTDIGTVRADLSDINAELAAFDGRTATIETDVGTLKTDTENIELEVTNVEGDIATISTILDAIKGKVLSIRDDVATIETDIGIVEATLPLTQTTIPLETPIEWALLLLAATVSITVIAATLLRKHKGTNRNKHTCNKRNTKRIT